MDKRLGLFLYCESTVWAQNTTEYFHLCEGDSYELDTTFLYREEKYVLDSFDELRIGPYEMVEW
jgi:hypothetical protein